MRDLVHFFSKNEENSDIYQTIEINNQHSISEIFDYIIDSLYENINLEFIKDKKVILNNNTYSSFSEGLSIYFFCFPNRKIEIKWIYLSPKINIIDVWNFLSLILRSFSEREYIKKNLIMLLCVEVMHAYASEVRKFQMKNEVLLELEEILQDIDEEKYLW